MERIRVAPGGNGFVRGAGPKQFVPWGVNYDHDPTGRLLEDYWEAEWDTVVQDFREMRGIGANVVRIHLQVGKFMAGPQEPRREALDRLGRLLEVAEANRLYVNLTGLGCYHKADVPAWYDALDEADRWRVQERFWEAVSEVGARSPAVFCYDLMNEPVVPGGETAQTDWLGPPFAGKHFVQFITRHRGSRARPEVAASWVKLLARAIRRKDPRGLVTVGLVDWSLERPGLTSGFVPARVATDLDFLSVHLYPKTGKLKEDLDTLAGFKLPGKPVVIEELFPLTASIPDTAEFVRQSRGTAHGWISFYWGSPPEAATREPHGALISGWLKRFRELGEEIKVGNTRPAPDSPGALVTDLESGRQSKPTGVRVILPRSAKDPGKRFPVLYLLPVEAEGGTQWGDPVREAVRLDLANRYQLICVVPGFAELPWYADHPTRSDLQQERYFIHTVVPAVESRFPVLPGASNRLLVGYSKSGWGAWSLLLRHPDRFARAAAWDAPMMMAEPGRYGSGPIFGTPSNFREYQLSRLLAGKSEDAAWKSGPPRLILMGFDNFQAEILEMKSLLERLGLSHGYQNGPKRRHHWESGWLEEAVRLVVGPAGAADS